MGDEEETTLGEASPDEGPPVSAPEFYGYGYQDDADDDQSDERMGCEQTGEMSLERMEQCEQYRTLAMLNQSEDRLFSLLDNPATQGGSTATTKSRAFYYSEGYEANHEPPDEQEVLSWQKKFSFLRVVGGRGRENEGSHAEAPEAPETLVTMAVKQFANCTTTTRGNVGDMEVNGGEQEEEIFAQHGSLDALSEGQAVDADEMRVQQTVAAAWPEVVEHLRPLIRRVFAMGDVRGFPRNLAQLEAFIKQQSRPSYDDFDDDNSWE